MVRRYRTQNRAKVRSLVTSGTIQVPQPHPMNSAGGSTKLVVIWYQSSDNWRMMIMKLLTSSICSLFSKSLLFCLCRYLSPSHVPHPVSLLVRSSSPFQSLSYILRPAFGLMMQCPPSVLFTRSFSWSGVSVGHVASLYAFRREGSGGRAQTLGLSDGRQTCEVASSWLCEFPRICDSV